MSAPDTNTEKQKRRHGPQLRTMIIGVGAILIALVAYLGLSSERGVQENAPQATTTDG